MNKDNENAYIERFKEIDKYIAGYLVHLESSKEELNVKFGIQNEKINIAYHGIYKPTNYDETATINDGKLHVVMYGYQTTYKGADILIEALKLLPPDYLSKIEVNILGKTERELLELAKSDLSYLNVRWNPTFVSEEELYGTIGKSNLILLPYRTITQSGVLLLALSFRKPIATSNLKSFKETLKGYQDDWFFESEKPQKLAELLIKYIEGQIDIVKQVRLVDNLIKLYSWDNTAKSTIAAYESIIS